MTRKARSQILYNDLQKSVCQPKAKSWDFTVQTLQRVWKIPE